MMDAKIDLNQMLEARERRASYQHELLEKYKCSLISFTMNIAGPIKNSTLIRAGFAIGCKRLENSLKQLEAYPLYTEKPDYVTGCEAYYLVPLEATELKKLSCKLEDADALGRLFDLDVLGADGEKLDRTQLGLEPRRCLLCDSAAKLCARSRTHSIEELQQITNQILYEAVRRSDADLAAELAAKALLYEVGTTPKPGLVDRFDSGSHRDMDIFTFFDSVCTLYPYFSQCVEIGRDTAELGATQTFALLNSAGRQAELKMFNATKGVNTHKGAIFSIGLICAALGRLPRTLWKATRLVLGEVAAMTEGQTAKAFEGLSYETAKTAGQRSYLDYGITGVRGQAEAGFPSVLQVGLPILEQGLAQGLNLNAAGCATLLHLLASTDDTNMISRSNRQTQLAYQKQLKELLSQEPYPDTGCLNRLNEEFVRLNLSPGGSADLLAICYLLYFLKTENEGTEHYDV